MIVNYSPPYLLIANVPTDGNYTDDHFKTQNPESLIGTFLYAIFPLNIYAVSQISSITLQMFLINLFLLYFIKIFNQTKHTDLIFFSIFSALLILLRGEFFLFVFFSIIFLMIKSKSFTKYFLSSLLIIILISPYLYRNYTIFNVLTITKSTGYNLLKGNKHGIKSCN